MVGADAVMLPAALWAALVLKFDRLSFSIADHWDLFLVGTVAAILIFSVLGLYRAIIRFIGPQAMVVVVVGIVLSAMTLAFYDRLHAQTNIPWSALAIYAALALLYLAASRFLVRYMFYYGLNGHAEATRVAIYGAGEAGAKLSAVLRGGPDFQPVAFIDDKRSLHGSRINGIKVSDPAELPALIDELQIGRVLLAMPAASRRRRREILERLEPLGVHVQSLPDLSEIISGKARIDELREVDAGDLLGRDPVPPDPALFERSIRDRCVMVTGAGGSIGSELCRQILRCSPQRLVLFEMSEIALYQIERELIDTTRNHNCTTEIIPLLGNAHHRPRLREVLATFGVQTVYHAAAYKHVPIVEHNIIEGIHNNVITTWCAAEAALEANVDTFVLVSTDKAVNPANVMGATKRFAEIVLQAMQQRSRHTRFCMVRFGNVLASSGSVVPLFQEQIRGGGPVTVTHPEVMRYFMTIPEAAQLVIQAGTMATGGDVFVLDMGQPVRIDDLARRLISLTGLTIRDQSNPDGDIEINYMGLRPAEKLFEELLIGANVAGTEHPKIMRAIEHGLSWEKTKQILDELLVALASFDCPRSMALLSDAVAEYPRRRNIRDYVWISKTTAAFSDDDRKVTELAPKRRLPEPGARASENNPRIL
ncbi:MAG: polysaccharide biosynthesis protein [Steroidobacterales bacterium]